MSSTEDDIVVRLRLADVAKFIRDVKSGRLSIDELEKKITKTGQVAKEEASSGHGLNLWGAAASQVKYAVAGLVLGLGSGAVALGTFAVRATASLEQVKVGFKTLLGSQSAADKMVSKLQDFAQITPYQLTDLERYTQMLLAFGMSADAVVPSLTAMGDAVSAFGGSAADLESVILAMGQIATKGRLMGDEILQLNEHKINPMPWLAKGLGVTEGQVRDMVQKGQISSATAIPLILKGMESSYAGSMEVQSHTLAGIWSNVIDRATREVTDRMQPLLPMMKTWLQDAYDNIPAIADWITQILEGAWSLGSKAVNFGQSLAGRLSAASGPVDLGQMLGSSVPAMVGTVMDYLKQWSGKADWYDIGTSVGKGAIGFVWGFLQGLFDLGAWWGVLKKHWFDMLMTLLAGLPMGKAFGWLGKILDHIPILKMLSGPLTKVGGLLEKVGGPIWKPITGLGRAIGRAFEKVFPEAAFRIWYFFSRIGEFVTTKIPDFFQSIPGRLGDGASWLFEKLFGLGKSGANWLANTRLGQAIRDLRDGIVEMFTDIWRAVWEPFKTIGRDAFKGVYNWFVGNWNSSVGSIPGIGGSVKLPFLAMGGTVSAAGTTVVGERGPELLNLPRGASVIPLPRVPDLSEMPSRPVIAQLFLNNRMIATAVATGTDDLVARR